MEAFERNVSPTERPHGARQRSERPGGPECLGAGSEDGDKEPEPGATGVSVRRGPEDRSAQPEAEERGELQRGEVSVRRDNTIPQKVSLQRLVPVLQPVQEPVPELQLLLQEPQQESEETEKRAVALS